MRFLVDAQLPRRLARCLTERGHDVVHTSTLPAGNRTTDAKLIESADNEDRAVITKDADFVDSFLISRKPNKLLLISTGNITNKNLEELILAHLATIVTTFDSHHFVELTTAAVIIHD